MYTLTPKNWNGKPIPHMAKKAASHKEVRTICHQMLGSDLTPSVEVSHPDLQTPVDVWGTAELDIVMRRVDTLSLDHAVFAYPPGY